MYIYMVVLFFFSLQDPAAEIAKTNAPRSAKREARDIHLHRPGAVRKLSGVTFPSPRKMMSCERQGALPGEKKK